MVKMARILMFLVCLIIFNQTAQAEVSAPAELLGPAEVSAPAEVTAPAEKILPAEKTLPAKKTPQIEEFSYVGLKFGMTRDDVAKLYPVAELGKLVIVVKNPNEAVEWVNCHFDFTGALYKIRVHYSDKAIEQLKIPYELNKYGFEEAVKKYFAYENYPVTDITQQEIEIIDLQKLEAYKKYSVETYLNFVTDAKEINKK